MAAQIWTEEFYYEIEDREVCHSWILNVDENLQKQKGWLQYTQRTFGKFWCSRCRNSWNSAEIHVLFIMKLNKALQQGTVKMRIFKQKCKKCTLSMFEKPEVSNANIIRVITNVCNRIEQAFYGQKKTRSHLQPEVYSNSKEGPHEKEYCEACKLHICKFQTIQTRKNKRKNKSKKSKSASSYKECSPSSYSDYESCFYEPYYEYYTDRFESYEPPKPKRGTSLRSIVIPVLIGLGALSLWLIKKK